MNILIFSILCALYDKDKVIYNHNSRFIFRFIIVALISIYEVPFILVGIIKPTIFQFLFNTAIFYLSFDYMLNVFKGLKWNYIGETSNFDKYWNSVGGWIPQLIFKIIFLTITILLKCSIL